MRCGYVKSIGDSGVNHCVKLFRRTARLPESSARLLKIRAEVVLRVEDLRRNSSSAELSDLFSAMREEDIVIRGMQPVRPLPPHKPSEAKAA
jgi:hypothetical protein